MPSPWLWAGADVAQLREAFAKDGMPGYLRKRIEQLEADGVPAYGPVGAKPDQTVQIARAYARLDEKEAAFDWLESAYRCTPGPVHFREDVTFDNLSADPRFSDLLRGIGILP